MHENYLLRICHHSVAEVYPISTLTRYSALLEHKNSTASMRWLYPTFVLRNSTGETHSWTDDIQYLDLL
jgi:hypothetical protein